MDLFVWLFYMIINFFLFKFLDFLYMNVLPMCASSVRPWYHEVQKRVLGPLELKW